MLSNTTAKNLLGYSHLGVLSPLITISYKNVAIGNYIQIITGGCEEEIYFFLFFKYNSSSSIRLKVFGAF